MGIQMNRKELTKTFIKILNRKTLWSPWPFQIYFSVERVYFTYCVKATLYYLLIDYNHCIPPAPHTLHYDVHDPRETVGV